MARQDVAVITGGAQGIGFACAQALIDAGSRVALWDMDKDAAEQAADGLNAQVADVALPVWADVTDLDGLQSALEQTQTVFGPVTQMVNSAGIAGLNTQIVNYPAEEWARVIDINLTGSFNMLRTVLPTMKAQNYGRIVLIASIAGKEGNPNASAYSASKAGVIGLTKSAGKETADTDIAVNCVTPAAAKTRIFDQMTQQHIDYMLGKIPRGRFVEVSEIAAMIRFLCAGENSFTTGAVFDLSGGRATY